KMSKAFPPKYAQILAALEENPNAAAVAREFGLHPQIVQRIAKREGIELTGRTKISSELRARIIAALKKNPNASAVAKQIGGVSHPTVWKIAKEAGIELSSSGANLRDIPINCRPIYTLKSPRRSKTTPTPPKSPKNSACTSQPSGRSPNAQALNLRAAAVP